MSRQGLPQDEEGHIDFLETQLQLLQSIGLERFMPLQAVRASDQD